MLLSLLRKEMSAAAAAWSRFLQIKKSNLKKSPIPNLQYRRKKARLLPNVRSGFK
jgi:hypothetical protein